MRNIDNNDKRNATVGFEAVEGHLWHDSSGSCGPKFGGNK
jgi:hypothetical protein